MNKHKVLIEISAGSDPIKYEIDPSTGRLEIDRFLTLNIKYPFNYGYFIDIMGEDGDELDAIVFAPFPILPGATLDVKVIGGVDLTDEKGRDYKVVCTPSDNLLPGVPPMNDITDLNKITVTDMLYFLDNYKTGEPDKYTIIKKLDNKSEALKHLKTRKLECQ